MGDGQPDQRRSGAPDPAGLSGSNGYIKSTPVCPSSGSYTSGNVGIAPTCTIAGRLAIPLAHILP